MAFSSLEFLSVFLPIVLILYYLIPSVSIQNILLAAASLLFYAYGEPVYIFLLLGSTVVNYIWGRLLGRYKSRTLLASAVMMNLLLLGIFKYATMAVTTLNSVLGTAFSEPDISLPIGISFYTFQTLSYLIDVYRQKVGAQKNYLHLLLYISFFPQLIAGPIVKYHDMEQQILHREKNLREIAEGFRRFIFGLAKKVLLSNTLAVAADAVFSLQTPQINIVTAWLGAVSYMLQIYFDFSGYSDMAIGLGHMFGFTFLENFRYPYAAVSIKEFWRRWHISLSTWFKEYLYIPLGGNRRGRARACINKLIVFFCTGLWHGANWTFVVWGLYHGLFLLFEEAVPVKKLPKMLGHLYTLLVTTVGFVIFRADTLPQAFRMIAKMFTGFSFGADLMSQALRLCTPLFLFTLVVSAVGAFPLKNIFLLRKANAEKKRQIKSPHTVVSAAWAQETPRRADSCRIEALSYVCACALLLLCMLRLSGGTYNPFIYFRF